MLRWYFWLALLFAVPIAAVFIPPLLLAPGMAGSRSTLAALGVGITISAVAVVMLGRRFDDDRGRPLSVAPRTARRAIGNALVYIPLLAWSGFCGCFGAGLVLAGLDGPGVDPAQAFSWSNFLMLVGALLPGMLVAVVVAISVRRNSEPTSDRRRGLCAQCGYDLRGLMADEKGYRICPECGAAWRSSGLTDES